MSLARSIEICIEWEDEAAKKGKFSSFSATLIEPAELNAGVLKIICGAEIAEFEKELTERILYMAHEAGRFTGND